MPRAVFGGRWAAQVSTDPLYGMSKGEESRTDVPIQTRLA